MTDKISVFSIAAEGDTFAIFKDGAPLQTPRTFPVTVPTLALARALLKECQGQGERLDLRKMPLMQMTLTSLDITAQHRAEVVDGIIRHGETELICHRASEPADLVSEQTRLWQPYIDWCQTRFNIHLRTGDGISPFAQDAEAVAALRAFVDSFDAFRLTAVSEIVGSIGSLVLGLALVTGHADVATIFAAAELDQLWQIKKWGDDPALEARHVSIRADLDMCVQWLQLLG